MHKPSLFATKCVGALVFATLAGAAGASAARLKAGATRVDITPPPGLPMYGYFDRIRDNRLSTGTLDPLYARVLVLGAGPARFALVALDLGRVFGPLSFRLLRDRVRERCGIANLFLTASHTHAGPNILDEYPSAVLPAWETSAIEKISAAVDEALRDAAEARLGAGYGEVFIGYNRRRVNADGTVTMLWTNPTKIPTAPVDPRVTVLRVDREDGSPLAILVNYACHPVTFGTDNLKYSADFPGVMAKTVERAFGGRPIAFFLQGADGDINPYFATTPLDQDPEKMRDWAGERLGLEAARAAKDIRTEPADEASLDFAEDALRFRVRWDSAKFRDDLLQKFGPRVFDDHADSFKDRAQAGLELPVTTLLINKRFAFVGMPGEPFVNFQIDWRARCPARDAFFLGYTNGYFDYFPTFQAATEGGYGAGDSNTYVEVGAGERMLDHALIKIYGMLGSVRELPQDLQKK